MVGFQAARGSRGRPSGSEGVKGLDYQGPRGSRGKGRGSQGVKG